MRYFKREKNRYNFKKRENLVMWGRGRTLCAIIFRIKKVKKN